MIEYTDKVFGKIKVLNVTEARANFANVLGDADSHYIITKNNKPLRVIINHAEYETLRRVGEAAGGEGLTLEEGVPVVDHLVEAFTREAAKDAALVEKAQESTRAAPVAKTPENPVKGILETNTALSKTEKPKPKRATPPKPLSESPLLAERAPDTQTESASASMQTLLASQGLFEREDDNDDYFYSAAGDVSETTDVLIEPDDDLESEIEIDPAHAENETNEPGVFAPQPKAAPKQKVTSQEPTPEESEYFQKYKKLYESVSLGSGNEQDDKEFEKRLQQKYANLYAEENKSQHLAQQEMTNSVDVHNSNDTVSQQPVARREVVKREIPKSHVQPQQIAEVEEESPQNYFTETDDEESAGLPSLKELLKDLEDEKLSGEEVGSEEGLNDRDIDDLIERITQD